MHKLNQRGELLIPLVIVLVLLLGSIGFGAWAFMGRQDYKNNVDAKIDEAVVAAEEKLSAEKEAEFAEQEKSPYETYQGPSAFGTLNFSYPKSWSAYIDETNNREITGYFHPRIVPSTNSETSFALRFEVVSQTYDKSMQSYESDVRSGRAKVTAYRAPKVSSELGSRVEGEIDTKKQGVMVLLPVRDKTIKIWTEGDGYRGDFTKVLESLTFEP